MFGFKRRAEERKRKRDEQDRRDGYGYAAGRLLRNESTPDSLRYEWDYKEGRTDFDRGVGEAIRDWESLNRKK